MRDKVPSEIVIGIDFGSSYSTVSYCYQDQIVTVHLGQSSNQKTFPSMICFDVDGKIKVGAEAEKIRYDPGVITFENLKKLILSNSLLTFKQTQIKVQHLIAEIFRELKKKVELKTGLRVNKAVLTVPAFFGQNLKTVLRDAAIVADLEVMRIINEPTAAAVYYVHNYPFKSTRCLFVDMGGQTLDFAVCEISKTMIDVESCYGDSYCGYSLVDQQIQNQLLKQIAEQSDSATRQTFVDDSILNRKLKDVAEQIKIGLANSPSSEITLRKSFSKDLTFDFRMTKRGYLKCHNLYFQKFKNAYDNLLSRSRYPEQQIESCILVGGPVNSSFLRDLVAKLIQVPVVEFDNITSVSRGAAIYGKKLLRKEQIVLSDVLPFSIGVETQNMIFERIMEPNFKIPCSRRTQFTTSEDFQTGALIRILEGERLKSEHCNLLGQILLQQIEIAYRGVPVIELLLEVDENGIIYAYVKDQKLNKQKKLVIRSPNRLSDVQISQIKEQSRIYRVQDLDYIKRMNVTTQIKDLENQYKRSLQESQLVLDPRFEQTQRRVLERINQKRHRMDQLSEGELDVMLQDIVDILTKLRSMIPKPQIKRR